MGDLDEMLVPIPGDLWKILQAAATANGMQPHEVMCRLIHLYLKIVG